ncbi:MAG: glycosyltransferase family 4 protein [Acidimicrobiales bacterium]
MHVLVVTVVHDPRDARIRKRQIESLLRAGHRVTYAAPWPADSPGDPDPSVTSIRLPRAHGRKRLRAQRAAWRTIRDLDGHVDLIVGHDPELLMGLGAAHFSVAVWDVHEDLPAAIGEKRWIPRLLRPVVAAAARRALRVLARRVDVILAEEGYRDEWPGAPVVPNTPWQPVEVPPPDDGRVVYVGRVSRGRGALTLVALASDERLRGRIHLYGPVDEDVAALVRDADARGDLHMHGFVPNDEVLRAIDGASVGLSPLGDLPNYRHSVPTKILEYAAHGVPVVTTPLTRATEIVRSAGCGVVVADFDPPTLADAVADLLGDDQRRARLARNGRDAVAARWSWDTDGPRFVALLEGFVAGAATRPGQLDDRDPGPAAEGGRES